MKKTLNLNQIFSLAKSRVQAENHSLSRAKWIPTWCQIKKFSNLPGLKISYVVPLIVPILASAVKAIETVPFLMKALLYVLDTNVLDIPQNMLRIFWASILIAIFHAFSKFFFPVILRDDCKKNEWKVSSYEAIAEKLNLQNSLGESNSELIAKEMDNFYDQQVYSQNFGRWFLRLLLGLLLLFAVSLLLLVAYSQISLVFKVTTIVGLFFPAP